MIDVSEIGAKGENIYHVSAVRIRVVGSGILTMTLYSLDRIKVQALPTVTMAATTQYEPRVLVNYESQRFYLQVKTTNLDEVFNINRIVVFAKEYRQDYPG